ncbi:hypothetical protein RB200_06015 [Streptomyces sp. PmtG]
MRVREIDDGEVIAWTTFREFCRYLRDLYPAEMRIALVLDNFSPHLTTLKRSPTSSQPLGRVFKRS